MQMNLFKRSAVTAGLAAMTLAVGSAQAYTFTLDVSGIFSNDELGSGINEVRFVDLSPGVQIVGLAWDVALFAEAPSWLSEISVALGDATDPNRLFLSPGFASARPGSESFSGSIDLVDEGLNFTLDATGRLNFQFYEITDDFSAQWDGIWESGSITVTYVPEPASFGLAALGLLGLASVGRRRRG